MIVFATSMPGRSHAGPLPPLTPEEIELRERLKAHVEALAGGIGERNAWHAGSLDRAAAFIEGQLAGLGYAVEKQDFSTTGEALRGVTFSNLTVEIPGASKAKEIVVVGAHYDTVPGSPGANDNGTGVAAVIELARVLKAERLPRTLRFVLFANEEQPFFTSDAMGSRVYAKAAKARGDAIAAMISVETVGYYPRAKGSQRYPFPLGFFYPDAGNFIGFVSNVGSRDLLRRAIGAFRSETAFPSEGLAAPALVPGVDWSDHASFWEQGYPAIMVTDTAPYRYPHYHSSSDTPDKIDYDSFARVVAGLAKVVAELAAD
ncbi:MAG: M20/M25/M40 family metallo-hydrolase [Rhodospirillales bacterium]|nr:M20/M25/M40 family metallo-hydrolase [Rhodospirillales bacterium]